ncbi:MAG TPA: hypothetical protein VK186_16060, partial [Candidatus Deferrimicrobium sp.]|nr:hypothetical protein [Candidatus Deferrimicrobium sp.]
IIPTEPPTPKKPAPPMEEKSAPRGQRPRKLTNKEKLELETLPKRIEELETEEHELYQTMSDPGFYKQDPVTVTGATGRLEALKNELSQAYQRWEELENIEKI